MLIEEKETDSERKIQKERETETIPKLIHISYLIYAFSKIVLLVVVGHLARSNEESCCCHRSDFQFVFLSTFNFANLCVYVFFCIYCVFCGGRGRRRGGGRGEFTFAN